MCPTLVGCCAQPLKVLATVLTTQSRNKAQPMGALKKPFKNEAAAGDLHVLAERVRLEVVFAVGSI
jgi:hypothetical protein